MQCNRKPRVGGGALGPDNGTDLGFGTENDQKSCQFEGENVMSLGGSQITYRRLEKALPCT